MKGIKILALIVYIFSVSQVQAQKGQLKMNLQYSYALPMGDFKTDIVSKGSPRGFTGDFLYGINDKFAVGLGIGFQDFYEKYPRALYNTGDKEVTSAVLSNSVQIIPLLAKGEFYPLGGKKSLIQPYINAGAGASLNSFTQYLGEFGGTDNTIGFMLQGGAGIFMPFSSYSKAGVKLGANYNMVSYNRYGFSNLNNLSFQAGIFFPIK